MRERPAGFSAYGGRSRRSRERERTVTELTDEQIAREEEFLEGIPRINLAALLIPPIWGPAHGFWASILFYPVWLFADNIFYSAVMERTPLAITLGIIVLITLTAGTVAFSLIGQPFAAHRSAGFGRDKQEYLRRERIWAVVGVVVGLLAIVLATYYNLVIRPTLGA